MDYIVKKPADMSKINVKDMGELIWWSLVFNITPERLLTTIDEVGNTAEAVRSKIR